MSNNEHAAGIALGVCLAGDTAYLTLLRDGDIDDSVQRFSVSRGMPRARAVLDALERFRRIIADMEIAAVGLLDAHGSYSPRSLQAVRDRLHVELIVELACAGLGVHYSLIAPATVASVLGLPTKKLHEHIDEFEPSGKYWRHRGQAALAAMAVGQDL